ncbi:peroxiredoxin [Acrasis kona]|uniref:Peroxiredoxin n=1 Tax=Acrasis kona TaxID=1008807 RepID=A0AAW2Z9D7_9EUKA
MHMDLQTFLTYIEDSIECSIPYGFTKEQVGMILVHYMMFHDQISTKTTKYEYGLPGNGITRILDKVDKALLDFSKLESLGDV